ncbi:MAG: hypothetical protein H0W33_08220 [Gammaproteobacteria bacterium]|nr:hypothetical protein [Gammaproteobacteria bacterium]
MRRHSSRLIILATIASLLCGCITTQVPVEGEFPAPVMRRLPYAVGVHYPEALKTFTHEEKVPSGRTWVVSLGEVHVSFFDQLFTGMFAKLIRIEELPAAGSRNRQVDGIIEPLIEDFQFATPGQTQSKFYEVWIRYRMSLYSPAGKLIESWPLSAYGKSRSQFAQARDSINDATVVAMRDAAALLATKFKAESEVPGWSATQEEKAGPVDYTEPGIDADEQQTQQQRAAGDKQPAAL